MSLSPEYYAEFLERMGHRVRRSRGLWWFNTMRGVYTPFPFDADVDPRSVDHNEVLGRDGLLLRYGCPQEYGVASARLICEARDYDFPHLRKRTRTQVRRGLEACRVEQIEFSDLTDAAIELNRDTLIRQDRRVPANLERYWREYYSAAARTAGAEAWAAFVDGKMAAYLIAFTIQDVVNLCILRSSLEHLKAYPNNALVFRFLSERLSDPCIRMVSYGYESIQGELGKLDQFKTGMGFIRQGVGQRIDVCRWLKPLVNGVTIGPMLRALQVAGSGEQAAKLKGMLRWYRDQPPLSAPRIPSDPTDSSNDPPAPSLQNAA